ncbi:hypothetical protein R3W88_009217 [Solanum pinnatisectum]|uniref:Translocon at the inner envelope membrane of chloroplasts 214 n=1 Tax=Solanum pinnatisectum TaxID=50273 RepID=A0AAV9MAW4_9SOLN|nr:hypothetical protein R3W88_009217 [Solanum pinnatisectum]
MRDKNSLILMILTKETVKEFQNFSIFLRKRPCDNLMYPMNHYKEHNPTQLGKNESISNEFEVYKNQRPNNHTIITVKFLNPKIQQKQKSETKNEGKTNNMRINQQTYKDTMKIKLEHL